MPTSLSLGGVWFWNWPEQDRRVPHGAEWGRAGAPRKTSWRFETRKGHFCIKGFLAVDDMTVDLGKSGLLTLWGDREMTKILGCTRSNYKGYFMNQNTIQTSYQKLFVKKCKKRQKETNNNLFIFLIKEQTVKIGPC
jgi:hypothetical protein